MGCTTSTPLLTKQMILSPSSELMDSCIKLPNFTGKTSKDLIEYNTLVIQEYGLCNLKLQALQQWVKTITKGK